MHGERHGRRGCATTTAGDRSPSTRRTHACPARVGSATHGVSCREDGPGEASDTWLPVTTHDHVDRRPASRHGRQRGPPPGVEESRKWYHHGTGILRSARTSLSPWPDGRSIPFIATLNKILPSLCYHRPPRDQCDPTQHPSRCF
jgi:hypothetical protein